MSRSTGSYTENGLQYHDEVTVTTDSYSYNKVDKETMLSNFDFLKSDGSIQTTLDEIKSEIEAAVDNTTAFDFNSGVNSLAEAKTVFDDLTEKLTTDLEGLHTSISDDIDSVVSEVNDNFNWPVKCYLSIIQVDETPTQ